MSPAEILAAHLAYDPVFLSKEAAVYLKVHPKTLHRLARDGKISHLQSTQGGLFKFRLSALNAYADSQETKCRQPSDQDINWGL